jgi:DNA-binding NarL/FixJ family response regulator
MLRHVLLADDHAYFRQSARALLESRGFAVAGEAANGQEAVRLAREIQPQVALIDLTMPVLSGLDAARQIVESCPATMVIVLTVHRDEQHTLSALRAGVRGYIVKARLADELEQAFDEVFRGRIWLSPPVRYPSAEALVAAADRGF